MNTPIAPLIPASANFSSMYAAIGEIVTPIVKVPQQLEIIVPNTSTAVSQDGSTAVIGYSGANSGMGSISIYVNNGLDVNSGLNWVLQDGPFVGSGYTGNSEQGASVAISANGNVVVVGGPADNSGTGAIWIFERAGTEWIQVAGPLVGTNSTGASQGSSVTISSDGTTVATGGPDGNSGIGAVWVYTGLSGTYVQQARLVGTGNIGNSNQGDSISITGNAEIGYTLLVGGYDDNSSIGAAWVFVNSGSGWIQQAKLVPTGVVGPYSYFGWSVSINENIAVISGPYDNSHVGAVWVFTDIDGVWTQTQKIIATGFIGSDPYEGFPIIVLSQDGLTLLIGSSYDNDETGAFWIFRYSNNGLFIQDTKFSTNMNTVPLIEFTNTLACNEDASIIFAGSETAVYVITFPA